MDVKCFFFYRIKIDQRNFSDILLTKQILLGSFAQALGTKELTLIYLI